MNGGAAAPPFFSSKASPLKSLSRDDTRAGPIDAAFRRPEGQAEWRTGGPARDSLSVRTADGMVCDVYTDRGTGASWLQRVMD